MNIFKKLFGKNKKVKKSEQEQQCWYNNAHESATSQLGVPIENVVTGGRVDFAITNKAAKS
ncbi:MAG: hypothetical protein IKC61_00125 [Clostridia bacterium]|nr:hypothetical protein [Clostridia bacterium]MBR2971315.1 hypothetical protein [Clostridia bacterium]